MQIEGLLTQYATQLLDKKMKLEAAELYRQSGRNTEAAKLLAEIAEELSEREVRIPPVFLSSARERTHTRSLARYSETASTGRLSKSIFPFVF